MRCWGCRDRNSTARCPVCYEEEKWGIHDDSCPYKAAISGGALSSQWDEATDNLLEERRDLWQKLANSDEEGLS